MTIFRSILKKILTVRIIPIEIFSDILLARKGAESFFNNKLSSLEWGEQEIFEECLKTLVLRLPLVVQWLALRVPCAGGLGLSPGQGTRSHRP